MKKVLAMALLLCSTIGSSPQDVVNRELSTKIVANSSTEDVYDFVDDLQAVSGIPILLEGTVKHQAIGVTLGSVTTAQAVGALCQRFGWIGFVTSDGMLDLGPPEQLQQRMPSDARVLSSCGSVGSVTRTYRVHYRLASDIAKAVSGFGQAQATGGVGGAAAVPLRVTADDDSHSLIVQGSASEVDIVGRTVAAIDVPRRRLKLDVTVYDYTPINNQANIGLDFEGAAFTSNSTGGSGSTSLLGGNSVQINAAFDALISKGRATVIDRPNLAGDDNQKLSINDGQTFFVTSVTNAAVGAQASTPFATGVIGTITPQIGNGFVTLNLDLQVSSIGPIQAGQPTIDKEELIEDITLRDGQGVIIGGLMSDTDTDTLGKVPILSSLPILGEFFKHRQSAQLKNQLVFVIEPEILDTIQEADTPAKTLPTPGPQASSFP